MVFAIHQCELAIGIHVFPHPEIAPTYLPTLALQVVTERWPWVPCVIHQTHTGYLYYRW